MPLRLQSLGEVLDLPAPTFGPLGFDVEFDQEGKLLPAWYGMVLLD